MENILWELNTVKKTAYKSETGRIDWCDIFKGILITLVVIGHATGKFNSYIYQFHMAAFFYISGYTATVQGRPVFQESIKLTYKLIIPYISINLAGLWIFWIFNKMNILHSISTTQYPAGFQDALSAFFVHGTVYCDWLGAMWFLPVLFGAGILFRVVVRVSKNVPVLLSTSILLFLAAEKYSRSGAYVNQWVLLAGIAQAFLTMGYCCRKMELKFSQNTVSADRWRILIKTALAGIIWYGLRMLGLRHTVDWPSRQFNGLIDLILPVCGILMTVNVSRFFCRMKHVKNLFTYLGKNSMGIMCFHFMGFKPAYLILVLSGRMQTADLYRLVPGGGIEKYWAVLTVMGIGFSLSLWKLLHKYSVTRFLTGGENASDVCRAVLNVKLAKHIKQLYDRSVNSTGRIIKKYFRYICCFIICTAVGIITIHLNKMFGNNRIEISFPYTGNAAVFSDGWLSQSMDENYRWFLSTAEIEMDLSRQSRLEIRGFIPESVENISYILLRINGTEVYRENMGNNEMVDISVDISEWIKHYRKNQIEIETDGIRNPTETDEDQRSFSGFVDFVCIE